MQKKTVNPMPVQLSLFPVMGSCQEAYNHIQAKLPITDPNELHALLMMYQNTLVQAWSKYNKGIQDVRNN